MLCFKRQHAQGYSSSVDAGGPCGAFFAQGQSPMRNGFVRYRQQGFHPLRIVPFVWQAGISHFCVPCCGRVYAHPKPPKVRS